MSGLSKQDREAVRRVIVHGSGCKAARGYADRCVCAFDLVPAVEAIVAAHVKAALTEAAEQIESERYSVWILAADLRETRSPVFSFHAARNRAAQIVRNLADTGASE